MLRRISPIKTSRCITQLFSRQLRQGVSCLHAQIANRGSQGIAAILLSGSRCGVERSLHTSCAWQDGQIGTRASEPGGYGDRRSEADFRAGIRDFLLHHRNVYESGSHEGRASINLRCSDPTSKSQIQERLTFFFDILTGCEALGGDSPSMMEIAKNVYIQLSSRMGSNVCVTVEFDRTIAGNSLNSATLESLASVFEGLQAISVLRGVLLIGAAGQKPTRAFSCGADIKEMQQLGDAEEASGFIKRISRVCTAIRQLPAPVVCGVDGTTLGAGLEIAASCDIRVATYQSTFGMPEVNLAIPSVVEARLLYDIIGVGRTKHFLLTGETLNAETALNYGLVTRLFDDRAQLLTWCAQLFEGFCSSLNVHTKQKDLMRVWEISNLEQGITAGIDAFANRFEGNLGHEVRSHMQTQWQKLKSGRR